MFTNYVDQLTDQSTRDARSANALSSVILVPNPFYFFWDMQVCEISINERNGFDCICLPGIRK